MRHRASICVDGDHPSLPGHFPGRPIVPGVVILDLVVRAAERQLGRPLDIVGLPQVKFAASLGPGEIADCAFEVDEARLGFRVERDGRAIAIGAFALARSAGRPSGDGA